MLTDAQCRKAKFDASKNRTVLADTMGLFLEIVKSGRKIWRVRIYRNKKEKIITLGDYPYLSLADARYKAYEARQNVKEGLPAVSKVRTFSEVAEEWLDKKMRPVRAAEHVRTIEIRLKAHVLPFIGDSPIGELKPLSVLPLLRRIEERGTIETAYRVANIISQILRYAVALGEVEHDFMPDLRGALQSKERGKHYAALTEPDDLRRFFAEVENVPSLIVRFGIMFNAYTFVRPTELRHAEWREIDFDNALWTIPAAKMKMKREHVVPLSRQALELLTDLNPFTGKSKFIFPQARDFSKCMSDATILVEIRKILKRAGLPDGSMTWHGFRAMASTTLNAHEWNIDAIERQLAHVPAGAVRNAYNRHEYMDIRRRMMQWYSDYLDTLITGE